MSEPTKEWWRRILNYGRKEIDKTEQKVRYVPDPEIVYNITLPLGTSYQAQTSNQTVFGDQKVLLGILGELEKLIFELKDRVSKIEAALAVSGFKPGSINKKEVVNDSKVKKSKEEKKKKV